jgi:hypothetical protein
MPKFCPECRSAMNDVAPACDSCGCSFHGTKPGKVKPWSDVALAAGTLLGVAGMIAGLFWAMRAGLVP